VSIEKLSLKVSSAVSAERLRELLAYDPVTTAASAAYANAARAIFGDFARIA
jgi:hypothetical protein